MLKHIISATSLAVLLPLSFAHAQQAASRPEVRQETPVPPVLPRTPEVAPNRLPLTNPRNLPGNPVRPSVNSRGGIDTGGGDLVTNGADTALLDMVEREPELDRSRPEPFPFTSGFTVRDDGYTYNPSQLHVSVLRSMLDNGMFVPVQWEGAKHPLFEKTLFTNALSRCLNGRNLNNHYDSENSAAVAQTSAIPQLKWAFMHEPLAEISDEGTIMMGDEDYRITQLAAQTGTQVLVHKASFFSMSEVNQEMLYLHEGLLCAVKHLNPSLITQQGTAPIRRLARHLYARSFRENFSITPANWPAPVASSPQALMDSYEALGIPTYMPERELRNEDGIKVSMSGFKGSPEPVITFETFVQFGSDLFSVKLNADTTSTIRQVCGARESNRNLRSGYSERHVNSCASGMNRWMTSNRARIQASWNAYLQE